MIDRKSVVNLDTRSTCVEVLDMSIYPLFGNSDATLISAQLIFRRSPISWHVTAVEKYPLALIGQLQLTGCQVVTRVGSVGLRLAVRLVMSVKIRQMKAPCGQH